MQFAETRLKYFKFEQICKEKLDGPTSPPTHLPTTAQTVA